MSEDELAYDAWRVNYNANKCKKYRASPAFKNSTKTGRPTEDVVIAPLPKSLQPPLADKIQDDWHDAAAPMEGDWQDAAATPAQTHAPSAPSTSLAPSSAAAPTPALALPTAPSPGARPRP